MQQYWQGSASRRLWPNGKAKISRWEGSQKVTGIVSGRSKRLANSTGYWPPALFFMFICCRETAGMTASFCNMEHMGVKLDKLNSNPTQGCFIPWAMRERRNSQLRCDRLLSFVLRNKRRFFRDAFRSTAGEQRLFGFRAHPAQTSAERWLAHRTQLCLQARKAPQKWPEKVSQPVWGS